MKEKWRATNEQFIVKCRQRLTVNSRSYRVKKRKEETSRILGSFVEGNYDASTDSLCVNFSFSVTFLTSLKLCGVSCCWLGGNNVKSKSERISSLQFKVLDLIQKQWEIVYQKKGSWLYKIDMRWNFNVTLTLRAYNPQPCWGGAADDEADAFIENTFFYILYMTFSPRVRRHQQVDNRRIFSTLSLEGIVAHLMAAMSWLHKIVKAWKINFNQCLRNEEKLLNFLWINAARAKNKYTSDGAMMLARLGNWKMKLERYFV